MARKRKLPTGMIQKPGRAGYWCDFRAGGRRIQKKLSNDFQAACKILNDLRARMDKAEFGLFDNDCSVEELRGAYERHITQALKPSPVERYKLSLDTILPAMGALKVSQFDTDAVLTYRQERLGSVSPRSVNHDTTILNAMLNWGVRHKLIGSNPLSALKPLRHDKPKQRRPLAVEEVERLLIASQEPWQSIWYAFLTTGMRFAELRELRFTDLDFDNREIIVRGDVAKNHSERRIPMDDELCAILRRLEAERDQRQPGSHVNPKLDAKIKALFTKDHVFVNTQNTPLRQTNLYRMFKACCKKSGIEFRTYSTTGELIEHVDIHSLRGTFATEAIAAGADPKSVQELLGHKTLDMTMRIYAKMRGATKRQAIAGLRYGSGSQTPEHLVEYQQPRSIRVQFGEKSLPRTEQAGSIRRKLLLRIDSRP